MRASSIRSQAARCAAFARGAAAALVVIGSLVSGALAQQGADEEPQPPVVQFAVTSPWPAIVNQGWWPAYAEIRNNTRETLEGRITGRSWTHRVELDVPVVLAPLEATRIELDLPAFHHNGSGSSDSNYSLTLRIRGHENERSSESIQRDGNTTVRTVVVATPRRLEGGIESAWAQAIKTRDVGGAGYAASVHGYGGVPPARLAVSATGGTRASASGSRPDVELAQVLYDELPTHVAAYSSLDLVLVPSVDRLPVAEQRAALLAWVRTGGRLALLGEPTLRAARSDPELAAWLEPRFRVRGGSDAAAVHACGLGWIGVASAEDPTDAAAADLVKELLNDFPLTAASPEPAPSLMIAAPRTARWSPAIPGLDQVPIRAFIAVLFVFWLLIGPVNFYLVATRWKKPALLLVTIPLLALVFSLLLFGYGIADQGLSTRHAVKSLSVLDQREHRVNSVDLRQLFIGFSAGDGLRPGPNTVVAPAATATEIDGENYFVRGGGDGALTGAFCPERTPQLLQVQSERSSRLRCYFVESGAGARFRNGLDAPLRTLLVCDFDGRVWRAVERVGVGAEVELQPIENASVELADLAGRHELADLALLRGSYLATLESNSLLDDCALGAEEVEGMHLLVGILEPSAAEQGESR